MSGVELRDMGTTATFSPRIKRGTARLSDGRAVHIVPDSNRSTSNGDDVTGVAKLYIYVSTDATRTAFTVHQTYTPPVPFASPTRYAVMSCSVRENDSLYVVYQATDSSLRMITFNFSAGAYQAGTEQTIVVSGGISNRFRAVDIDVIPTNANMMVATYEAAATTGQGAFARVYARMDDGVTWTRAYTTTIFTSEFIKTNSEDISLACNKAGKTSNVIQLAMYFTKTHTAGDNGDTLREISFNVNTGTTDSATVIGSWITNLWRNQTSGARKGMLFSEANNVWMFGAAVGSSVPFFASLRLYHNVFTGLVYNQSSTTIQQARNAGIYIDRSYSEYNVVGFEYCDYNLVIAFAGPGYLTVQAARSVVIRYDSNTALPGATRVDTSARVLDNGYLFANQGVIGVYGGGNKNLTSSLAAYNFSVIYGYAGDTVSTTPLTLGRKIRAVPEDVLSAPVILVPVGSTVTTDRVTVRVQAQNSSLYSSVLGKLQIQVASDSGFTTNSQVIDESIDQFYSYSATSGTTPPIRSLVYKLTQAQALFSGLWYLRARVVDDLGGVSAWSTTATFTVSHPPVALPLSPANTSSILYGGGTFPFSWKFTDPEPVDSQSAYQIVVLRNDTGVAVLNPGKVVTTGETQTHSLAVGLKDIPLQWRVSLWDSDDVQGPFSAPQIFTLVDPPDVVVTGPVEGSTINTALPTVTWTFTAGGVRTQRAYRVRIWDTDATPDQEIVDTGWIFSDVVSHAFAEQILEEGVNYRADVYVLDSVNLGDNDSNAFTTDWLPPVAVDSQAVTVDEFKATITWDDSDNDTDWVGYRVYRRYMEVAIPELDIDLTATTWKLLAEVTEVNTSYTVHDYTLPLNREVEYVVVQVADRFGALLESDIGVVDSVMSVGNRYYFVPEVPVGTIASFEASYVVGDAFTRDVEQNTLHVIGRGRQVQIGDDLGYSGTLTIHLRNPASARVDREFLEYLSTSGAGKVYIRSPFGDVLYCSFGNISSTRIAGVGTEDLVDLTIPYTTVYREVSLTRAGT